MTTCRLHAREYTVGWICALPIELAASQVLLDEEHEKPDHQDIWDPNLYTLGRICTHNVVLACLPAGSTGTQSAAIVAAQMRSQYPSIRFGLMVGIGGGVPSADADIRLGDVVISQPYLQHGGVVQYDFGKTEADGILRTGWLNAPPAILLHAIAEQRAMHYRGRDSLSTILSAFKAPNLELFSRGRAGSDVLYKASYDHIGQFATCEKCSKEMEIIRPLRQGDQEVAIHYGTIASGNQVMKNGTTRDKISEKLGGIKCFEMEAAGLMNNFPCLVVRGVCDYADSHKNKSWQPYAASTASACAKALLALIPTVQRTDNTTLLDQTIQGRIEMKLDQLFDEIRQGFRSPTLAGLANNRSALEKELVDGTVTEIDVEDNKHFIDDWLKNCQSKASGVSNEEDFMEPTEEDYYDETRIRKRSEPTSSKFDIATTGTVTQSRSSTSVDTPAVVRDKSPSKFGPWSAVMSGSDSRAASGTFKPQDVRKHSSRKATPISHQKTEDDFDSTNSSYSNNATRKEKTTTAGGETIFRREGTGHYRRRRMRTAGVTDPEKSTSGRASEGSAKVPMTVHRRERNKDREMPFEAERSRSRSRRRSRSRSRVREVEEPAEIERSRSRGRRKSRSRSRSIYGRSRSRARENDEHSEIERSRSRQGKASGRPRTRGKAFSEYPWNSEDNKRRADPFELLWKEDTNLEKVIELPVYVTLEELFHGCTKRLQRIWTSSTGFNLSVENVIDVDSELSSQHSVIGKPDLYAKIAKGMKNGSRIELPGMGDILSERDLHLIVTQKMHSRFERRGNDLHCFITITLLESICGWKTMIEGIDGHFIKIRNGITPPSWTKTIPGGGMPIEERPQERGNLIIKVAIEYPKSLTLTTEQRKELKSIIGTNVDD